MDWLPLAGNAMRSFVFGDFIGVFERQADVVEAVEQAISPKLFDFEFDREAAIVGERAGV